MENARAPLVGRGSIAVFAMLTACFVLWGLLNNMTDNLVPAFQKIFCTSQSTAGYVQVAFYGAYSAVALFASLLVQRAGYRAGVLVGLGVYCLGALAYVPACILQSFWTYIAGIFVVAAGCAVLETTCNPYVLALGERDTAVRRLNFAQMFNPLGSFAGIVLAQNLILANLHPAGAEERLAMPPEELRAIVHSELFWVCVPYVGLCAIAAAIWLFFFFSKAAGSAGREDGVRAPACEVLRILAHSPRWYCGVVAQVFYVGVQIAAWTWMNAYCQKELGVTTAQGATYYLVGLSLFIVCRWICTFLMKWFDPARMMAVSAACAILSCAGVMYLPSTVLFTVCGLPFSGNVLCLCAMSGFMSLMFPTIYGIGLGGIDPRAHKIGAAGLIMAIVGGALLTPWMASVIDSPGAWASLVPCADAAVDPNLHASSASLRASFAIPAICFAVVFAYAVAFRARRREPECAQPTDSLAIG